MCGIAIEDDKKRSGEMEVNHDDLKETDKMKLMKVDHEMMGVLKFVLDGEFVDEDLLPELLKMNKSKLVKGIELLLVMRKLISLRGKLKNTSPDIPMLVILCLMIIIK
jgi:hypothetical protein